MKGQCYCGEVRFELLGEVPNIYQCHCSLCRKVSGSSSNSAILVKAENFKWKKGEHRITHFVGQSGFISDFCSSCGSPLPNPWESRDGYWVPAGLLEDVGDLKIVAHVYVDSKAGWDLVTNKAECFAEMPDDEMLNKLIQPGRTDSNG